MIVYRLKDTHTGLYYRTGTRVGANAASYFDDPVGDVYTSKQKALDDLRHVCMDLHFDGVSYADSYNRYSIATSTITDIDDREAGNIFAYLESQAVRSYG